MAKTKIGIIGAGGISSGMHIPAWKNINSAEITAIADIDGQRAENIAKEHGIPLAFTDYRDLLKSGVDIVDVCTPNRVHTPAVLAALEAGCHVICEKPLAVTTAEVRQMGELADRQRLKLMTAQHMRWNPPATAIQQWAAAGNLGHVYHARVRACRRAFLPCAPSFINKELSGGGPCMDIGVHALDTCLHTMGFPTPVRVTGTAKTNFAKGDTIPGLAGEWDRELFSVEDFAAGFVHFDNGATLNLEASWLAHQEERADFSFQLFGTKAGVHWPSGKYAGTVNRVFTDGHVFSPQEQNAGHAEEIKAFHRCVTENLPSPVPWTETIKVIAILEAIYQSSETNREVIIKL